ncbi:Upstream stimulatory factor 1 [Mucor velutinosus]|uniref:Upstream stimulatory factor 1 n=1 Tax=Mucor velutinosus TaxID=708070 RepID=A0AAN7DES8_9FUNG|nr:Upstream stimulatory factor 1 [Mucor velutinosus]
MDSGSATITTTDKAWTKRPSDPNMSDEIKEDIKKPRTDDDDLKLTAKQKKKAAKARKLGMSYHVIDNELVIQPKLFFKHFNDFATMKDARNLMLTALAPKGKQARLAEIPDFPGVAPVRRAIMIDVPIYDPFEMGLPIEARNVSKADSAAVYDQMKAEPLYEYIKQMDDESTEILGLISAAGFDQYKRVHDRFLDLLEVPLSKGEIKKKREEEDKDPDQKRAIVPEVLIMTKEELQMEDFPIPMSLDPYSVLEDGWVDTLPGAGLTPKRLVALDCEMCKTVNGYAVTRVALVDRDNNQLINELVKPSEEITDYVTHISGVDEKSLIGISTTLADIQKKIQKYVDGDTILVGHGLVNDMKCLKMRHPYIIDTAIIYHHKNGPPYKPSLRDLTVRYLKRTIQIRDEDKKPGEDKGHDPCEDAIASLELLERKLRYGINYGLAGLSQVETIIDFLKRSNQQGAVIECNADLSQLMKNKLAENNTEDYCPKQTDEEVTQKVIEQHKHRDLVLARFDLPQESEQERRRAFFSMFKEIHQAMEPNTAFCITTGYRSNKQRDQLREKRVEYKKKLKKVGLAEIPMEERWSIDDEHLLEKVADDTRRGFIFSSVKNA